LRLSIIVIIVLPVVRSLAIAFGLSTKLNKIEVLELVLNDNKQELEQVK